MLVDGSARAGVFLAWDRGCWLEGGDGLACALDQVLGGWGRRRGAVVGGRLREVVRADC